MTSKGSNVVRQSWPKKNTTSAMLFSQLIRFTLLVLFSVIRVNSVVLEPQAGAQGDAQGDSQSALIIPFYGYPSVMKIRTMLYRSNRHSATKAVATLSLHCSTDEVDSESNIPGEKTLVLGQWDYRNMEPTAAITFTNNEEPIFSHFLNMYSFCVKTIARYDTLLARLLKKFDKKMVSFWWDSKTPLYGGEAPINAIGEVALGGTNPARFVADTEVRIKVDPLNNSPFAKTFWVPTQQLPVRIGNKATNKRHKLSIDIKGFSSIPTEVYDAITAQLRSERAFSIASLKFLPAEIAQKVGLYSDFKDSIEVFDCKDASKLLPLHIGPLKITPKMLYERVTGNQCRITLRKNMHSTLQNNIEIGIDLIRHFYFSINFDADNGDSVVFATRVEDESDDPADSLVSRESSSSPDHAILNSQRPRIRNSTESCCAIS